MTGTAKARRGRPSKAERREAARRRARRRTLGIGLGVALAVGLLAAVALTGGGGHRTRPAPPGEVEVAGGPRDAPLAAGEPLPPFSAPGLDGGRVAWEPGRPTVLAVWAPWCPHCQAELPVLARVAADHPAVALVTVATALDLHPGPDPADYLADHGLSFPVALDDRAGSLASALGVQGFPTVYFVGSDGAVVEVTVGETDEATLRALFSSLR
ncbi:MAG TPA: TlpA disulfide reductase family protein [Actinomycetota bacterium]|nr:TlpA disulfide reductase family protein [Actinomycetota bacterium]